MHTLKDLRNNRLHTKHISESQYNLKNFITNEAEKKSLFHYYVGSHKRTMNSLY